MRCFGPLSLYPAPRCAAVVSRELRGGAAPWMP